MKNYTYSCEILPGKSAGWQKISYYNKNKEYLSYIYFTNQTKTITLPTNCEYLRIGYHINFVKNVQLELGSSSSEYQPYTDNPTYKNIENIPSTMRNSYLEIMNNGTDKIWNNWEKVTGEGETLTLNSTEEAPMKINLKGNTSQETTTGKNLNLI